MKVQEADGAIVTDVAVDEARADASAECDCPICHHRADSLNNKPARPSRSIGGTSGLLADKFPPCRSSKTDAHVQQGLLHGFAVAIPLPD